MKFLAHVVICGSLFATQARAAINLCPSQLVELSFKQAYVLTDKTGFAGFRSALEKNIPYVDVLRAMGSEPSRKIKKIIILQDAEDAMALFQVLENEFPLSLQLHRRIYPINRAIRYTSAYLVGQAAAATVAGVFGILPLDVVAPLTLPLGYMGIVGSGVSWNVRTEDDRQPISHRAVRARIQKQRALWHPDAAPGVAYSTWIFLSRSTQKEGSATRRIITYRTQDGRTTTAVVFEGQDF